MRSACRFGDLAVPSAGMPPILTTRRSLLLCVAAIVVAVLAAPAELPTAGAGQPTPRAADVPAGCVQHSGDQGADYRCAGRFLATPSGPHTWAGQWLFVDESGRTRRGTCTYQLGTHPTTAVAAHRVAASLPNDPTGQRSAYLTWKYGQTDDDLTAAAMWVVAHYYSQDESARGAGPLIPSLTDNAVTAGFPDLQRRAVDLDVEAERMSGEWVLTASLAPDGMLALELTTSALPDAAPSPVPDQPISVLVSGSALPLAATTSADGTTTVAVPIPSSGTVTVVATAAAPGPAEVYLGEPALPDADGAQPLLTAGRAGVVQATVRLDVPEPTGPTPTDPTPTDPPPTDPTPTDPAAASTPLPHTGGRGDGAVAYLATALLVGGIGLLGTLRRREPHRESAIALPRLQSGG